MHLQISGRKNYTKTSGDLTMSRGTTAQILLYGALMGLIISKVFTLNRETNFQSQCPYLPSNVQERA